MIRRDHSAAPRDRVAVTGIGLRTALGDDRETTWRALLAGKSGAKVVEVDRLGPRAAFPVVGVRGNSDLRSETLALVLGSAHEALLDAGLERRGPRGLPSRLRDHVDPTRVGVIVGLSKGDVRGLSRFAEWSQSPEAGDPPSLWTMLWPHAAGDFLASDIHVAGPRSSPVAACATGLVAALQAADWIERGVCDIVLAGAADSSLEPLILAAFDRMRILAHGRTLGSDPDPTRLVRPGDRARNGFLVGAGAAMLVLEGAAHAEARGALSYANFAGGALGSNPHAIIEPDPDPSRLADFLARAVAQSNVDMKRIDHVNLHATATRVGDPIEFAAVGRALGARADDVPCVAHKAQIGHLLGAAGAAELALVCLAIRDGVVPPTINRDDPDPACNLFLPRVAWPHPIAAALKLSIGFGGHLAAAVLTKPDGPRRAGTLNQAPCAQPEALR